MPKKIAMDIPIELYKEFETIAKAHGITTKIVIQRMFKLGLLAAKQPVFFRNESGAFFEVSIFEEGDD